jgi:prepilin-type N-terminal cleavage/methylation domain-containing protein
MKSSPTARTRSALTSLKVPGASRSSGFTLVEMTIVMMILLTLVGVGFYSANSIKDWRLGRDASEKLRTVHTAQRLCLSDNPTLAVSALTPVLVIPYLPNQATSIPTVESLTGATLAIKVDVFPPIINNGSGGFYDPSGSRKDSLWDVGE